MIFSPLQTDSASNLYSTTDSRRFLCDLLVDTRVCRFYCVRYSIVVLRWVKLWYRLRIVVSSLAAEASMEMSEIPLTVDDQREPGHERRRRRYVRPTVEDYDSSASLVDRNDDDTQDISVVAAQDRVPRPYRRSRSTPRPNVSRSHTLTESLFVPGATRNATSHAQSDEYPAPAKDNPFVPRRDSFVPVREPFIGAPAQNSSFHQPQQFTPFAAGPHIHNFGSPYPISTPQGFHPSYPRYQHYEFPAQRVPTEPYSYFGAPSPAYSYPYSQDPYAPQSIPRTQTHGEIYGQPYSLHAPFYPASPLVPNLHHPQASGQQPPNNVQRPTKPPQYERNGNDLEKDPRGKDEVRRASRRARQKKELEKMKRRYELKAKAQVDRALRKQKEAETNNKSVEPKSASAATNDASLFPALTKKMEDALKHLDETRDSEPDRVLDDIVLFVENQKRQGAGKSKGGRSHISRATSQQSSTSSLHSLKDNPNLQNEVRDVLLALELIRSMKLEDEESERMTASPIVEHETSLDDGRTNNEQRRDEAGPSRPRVRIEPASDARHRSVDCLQVSGSPAKANTQTPRPSLQRREGAYSHRAPAISEELPMTPKSKDSGYTSLQSPRHEGRPLESILQRGHGGLRDTPGEVGQSIHPPNKSKTRRAANPQAYQGILSSDESEPHNLRTGRAAYAPTSHVSNPGRSSATRVLPRVPDVPDDRS